MLQNLQNFAKFKNIQLDNLVDFEKCSKTRIYLQRSAPIQPKTSEILPKFCRNFAKNWQLPYGSCRFRSAGTSPSETCTILAEHVHQERAAEGT